jgi:hypothetical protein
MVDTACPLALLQEEVAFFDKGNILISKYTNYTQPLQQRSTLIVLRMHTAKKEKEN